MPRLVQVGYKELYEHCVGVTAVAVATVGGRHAWASCSNAFLNE